MKVRNLTGKNGKGKNGCAIWNFGVSRLSWFVLFC